ncbi:hypothetical protein R1sor_026971 [Riccia sorocarpa]|uniref:Alkyl transferase n=1 Tax=Riccia sorocarpa TaxID=122646 RepID=A0ABD3GCV8_9MARC
MEAAKLMNGSSVQSLLPSHLKSACWPAENRIQAGSSSGSACAPSISGRGLSCKWRNGHRIMIVPATSDFEFSSRRTPTDLWFKTLTKKNRATCRKRMKVLGLGDQLHSTLDFESQLEVPHRSLFPSSPAVVTGRKGNLSKLALPSELRSELMPKHVAIIMDGNSRWAKRRGLNSGFGHAAGADALQNIAKVADSWGIQVLTVFAFSTENWLRPQMEVQFLMQLFESKLEAEMPNIMKHEFKLRFIGDTKTLPPSVQTAAEMAEKTTGKNSGMIINICVSYSGRADIVRACRELAAQVAAGRLNPADIDDAVISRTVSMNELGALQEPELLIRTSGEQRISNFMLWQLAYSELVFVDTLWPDFDAEDLKAALVTYQRRDRRFGKRVS